MNKGGQQNSYVSTKVIQRKEGIESELWRFGEWVFEVTEQGLADQTSVIRTNGWLSEKELDEIQRKIKEEENMEDPKIELQNTCGQRKHYRMKMTLKWRTFKICLLID